MSGSAPPFQVEAVAPAVRRSLAWIVAAGAAGAPIIAAALAWNAGNAAAAALLALAAATAVIPLAAVRSGLAPRALRWTGDGWQVSPGPANAVPGGPAWHPVESVGIVLALPSAVLLRVHWAAGGVRRRDDLLPLMQSQVGALRWRLLHSTLRHGRPPRPADT